MQRLEVSGAVRPIYGSLGVKRLKLYTSQIRGSNSRHSAQWCQSVCTSKQIWYKLVIANIYQSNWYAV